MRNLRARFDNFLPDPEAVRAHALAQPFIDWEGPDGQTYKRVWIGEVPGLQDAIERAISRPIDMHGQGYRLNFGGEMPNAAIHSDMGWGTHAAVCYLAEPPRDHFGGTAFWQHNATGARRIDPGDFELFERLRGDWNDAGRWTMTELARFAYNSAAVYDGSLFHSRYPFAAFGTGPADGRLVAVAFFRVRSP